MDRFGSHTFDPEAFVQAKAAAPLPWPGSLDYLDFLSLQIPKPRPLISGLLDAGSRIMLGGGSKTFKTWLFCDLAISIAAGEPWLGFETHQVPVLYVNFELREYYFRSRLSAIQNAKKLSIPKDQLFVWTLRGTQFSLDTFIPLLIEKIQQHAIAIVFIDPFYKLLSPLDDENSQTHMVAILNRFNPLIADGVTTAFAMHYSKGNQAAKDPIDRISGAGSLGRDPDNLITLTRHQEEHSFVVDFIIRDFSPVEPFVISWQNPLLVRSDLNPKDLHQNRGPDQSCQASDLIELLRQNDDAWKTKDFEREAIEQLGWQRASFYRRLKELKTSKKAFVSKTSKCWNVSSAHA